MRDFPACSQNIFYTLWSINFNQGSYILLLCLISQSWIVHLVSFKKYSKFSKSILEEDFDSVSKGLPWWLSGKESACNAGDPDLIPRSGRSPGGGHSDPLQCSCLEKSMDRGAWWAIVHRVAKSRTQLKWLNTHTAQFLYLLFSYSLQTSSPQPKTSTHLAKQV